jgi:hypothetical protein
MQTNRITQHYRNRYHRVEPICPVARPRYNDDAEQAEYLRRWTEKRKQRQRLQVVPRTETREEIEMYKLEVKIMDWVGRITGVVAAILFIWFIGAVITAIRAGW